MSPACRKGGRACARSGRGGRGGRRGAGRAAGGGAARRQVVGLADQVGALVDLGLVGRQVAPSQGVVGRGKGGGRLVEQVLDRWCTGGRRRGRRGRGGRRLLFLRQRAGRPEDV